MSQLAQDVAAAIRDIPDFPKPGVLFKDITPVLADGELYKRVVDWFTNIVNDSGAEYVVAMESRGFLFAAPIVDRLGIGLLPARKPGKLPFNKIGVDYELEYATGRLELHTDVLKGHHKVIVVDDLLATGGTAKATVELVRQLGAEVVGCAFMIELDFLGGRQHLDCEVHSLVHY
ncbi:MAG: adenine phosphoribosyltransferase [Deltaproteobacteria bacterium]|nr:MAG: adenine phosphoribosyltransferase [Deltaproteobacteria bacterium]